MARAFACLALLAVGCGGALANDSTCTVIRRHMTASFAIPVSSSFLLCAGSRLPEKK